MIKLSQKTCLVEIPALTHVGEEFSLMGSDFSPNAIGRIDQVVGQGQGGKTRVRMSLLRGEILYENSPQDDYALKMSQSSQNPKRGGTRKQERLGGSPMPTVDIAPRTGERNQEVRNQSPSLLEASVTVPPEQAKHAFQISKAAHARSMGIELEEAVSDVGGGRRSKVSIPVPERVQQKQMMEDNAPRVYVKQQLKQAPPDSLDEDPWGDTEN